MYELARPRARAPAAWRHLALPNAASKQDRSSTNEANQSKEGFRFWSCTKWLEGLEEDRLAADRLEEKPSFPLSLCALA